MLEGAKPCSSLHALTRPFICALSQVDWADPANAPAKPALLGTKVYQDYPIEELLPYIDWNPFFQVTAGACLHAFGLP